MSYPVCYDLRSMKHDRLNSAGRDQPQARSSPKPHQVRQVPCEAKTFLEIIDAVHKIVYVHRELLCWPMSVNAAAGLVDSSRLPLDATPKSGSPFKIV